MRVRARVMMRVMMRMAARVRTEGGVAEGSRRILLGRPSHLRLGEQRWHGDRLWRGRSLAMHELVRLLEPPCVDKQPHLAPHAARQTRDVASSGRRHFAHLEERSEARHLISHLISLCH